VRLALIGGSFNPPHVGHLLAATYVRATQPVDEVWLLPAFHHPFGKEMVAFEHRLRMCEAVSGDAGGWLRASGVEREVGKEGWTVDTLEHLRRTRPADELTWVIGSDILPDLPRWKRFDRIQELARVLVLYRAGHPAPEAVGPPLAEVSSTQIRRMLEAGEDPGTLVPRAVLAYARSHGLYRR
jgi:nicotinate-nucleotide adenylyltransferase